MREEEPFFSSEQSRQEREVLSVEDQMEQLQVHYINPSNVCWKGGKKVIVRPSQLSPSICRAAFFFYFYLLFQIINQATSTYFKDKKH